MSGLGYDICCDNIVQFKDCFLVDGEEDFSIDAHGEIGELMDVKMYFQRRKRKIKYST